MSTAANGDPTAAMPGAASARPYDSTTVALHWVTALAVAALWVLGQTIDFFPRGSARTGARTIHILLGAALVLVLIARVLWRIRWGRRLPLANSGAMGQAARLVHWGLYLIVAATLALGVANAWIRGDQLLGLFKIPSIAPGDKALRELVEDWHGTAANILLIVAGLHALAGLIHHFYLRDGVLARMSLSRRSPGER